MNRTSGVLLLLAGLGGCMSAQGRSGMGDGPLVGCRGGCPPTVPGVQGPWGRPVVMAAPYSASPPGEQAAKEMLAQSLPLQMMQGPGVTAAGSGVVPASYKASGDSGIVQASGSCPAGGCAPGMLPPGMMPPGMPSAAAMSPPGMPPGPGMPGGAGMGPPGAVASAGALTMPTPNRFATQRTSVRFVNPTGMKVAWYAPGPDGRTGFSANQLEVPGRYNFVQAAIYRLKLTDVPGRPNLELYPTLEVVPSNLRSNAFLAHSSVPVSFTEEDLEQVTAGNYVVKVIYLPDPQFQDLAATGTDEVVSSRLEPGVDPIAEAYRRGSILLIVRLGNIDLEAPNTPAMDAPSRNPTRMGQGAPMPGMPTAPMPHQMGMGGQPGMPTVGLPPSMPMPAVGPPPGMPMPAAPGMPNGPGSMAPTPEAGTSGQPMSPPVRPTPDGGSTAAPTPGEVGQVIYTEASDGTPVEQSSRRPKRWCFQKWFHSKEPASP